MCVGHISEYSSTSLPECKGVKGLILLMTLVGSALIENHGMWLVRELTLSEANFACLPSVETQKFGCPLSILCEGHIYLSGITANFLTPSIPLQAEWLGSANCILLLLPIHSSIPSDCGVIPQNYS